MPPDAAALEAATQAVQDMRLVPGVVEKGSSAIVAVNSGVDLLGSVSSFLTTLKRFNDFTDKISAVSCSCYENALTLIYLQIHPYVQAACTVLGGISKVCPVTNRKFDKI